MKTTGHVILAGGSGFVGTSLSRYLINLGCKVTQLTRSPTESEVRGVEQVAWNAQTVGPWKELLQGALAIINLAGKNINCLHTPENKREIISSRVNSVRAIGEAIRQCSNPPKVWIQSGAVGIYGNSGERVCDENSPFGSGFIAETCKQWESEFNSFSVPHTRKVLFRIGMVLGKRGGALEVMERLVRAYLGGTVGSGSQYVSWIHIDDLNEIFRWAIEHEDTRGTYNATAPNPVTNREFMRSLRRALHRPWSPPAPSWAVRLGAKFFLGTEPELALSGCRCYPKKIEAQGFKFRLSHLNDALLEIYGMSGTSSR